MVKVMVFEDEFDDYIRYVFKEVMLGSFIII